MSVCETILSFSLLNHRFRQEHMLLCTLCKVSRMYYYSSNGEQVDPRVSLLHTYRGMSNRRTNLTLILASVSLLITQQILWRKALDVSFHIFYVKNVSALDWVSVGLHLKASEHLKYIFYILKQTRNCMKHEPVIFDLFTGRLWSSHVTVFFHLY